MSSSNSPRSTRPECWEGEASAEPMGGITGLSKTLESANIRLTPAQRALRPPVFFVVLASIILGCSKPTPEPSAPVTAPKPTSAPTVDTPERREAAQALFERTVNDFHNPSARALPEKRVPLLEGAAKRYQQLLEEYPEQKHWCAQALRNLGGTQAELGRTEVALKHYDRVAIAYGEFDFEVMQAWKAAADLLWDLDRKAEAKVYYTKIIDRFDREEVLPVYKVILNLAKKRTGD